MPCPICEHDKVNMCVVNEGKFCKVTILCAKCGFGIKNKKMKVKEFETLFKAGYNQ